uniref:NADH-ubiquinone oxidoreductase chain 3 n=1 Tax=Lycorma delicatula TaxID=130591 RepID=K7N7I0_LYCDL|nr:NADH dehydrogenase subunit 3 [Lycorma delicatula]
MKITLTMMSLSSIIILMMIITMVITKKNKMSRDKNPPFECGFSKMTSTRKSFSTHFFLVATVFLIFDIEISMIVPMFSTKMVNMDEWLISSTITIMILILGLMHEWKIKMRMN